MEIVHAVVGVVGSVVDGVVGVVDSVVNRFGSFSEKNKKSFQDLKTVFVELKEASFFLSKVGFPREINFLKLWSLGCLYLSGWFP